MEVLCYKMTSKEWKYYIDKANKIYEEIRNDRILFRIEMNKVFNPKRYNFELNLIEDDTTKCGNLVLHKFLNTNYLLETEKEVYESLIGNLND
jgi:hypothetical protein